tara:strand:+ start:2584 stop:3141 length:558 start_codon:yes stop_codon:yes gene_type:complete
MSIDFSRVNFEEFFGWVNASNTKQMKSSSFRGLRAHYTEKSFSKWSDNQLTHVGLYDIGRDFIIKETGESVEMKTQLGMFKKKRGCGDCKPFVLKSFHPSGKSKKNWKKKDLVKTFDYLLLIDTESMSVGYTTWDKVYERIDESSNEPKCALKKGDYTMIVSNITPAEREENIVDETFCSVETVL